ncbi:MAG: hemerythrin domain-containing protein [Marinobacterium sp.]|nr:hemerythrin domain-containing protein [Marinobacterium sp.]
MTILEQLRQDHTNMRCLLNILNKKVSKLRSGEHPNFGLLDEVIDYLRNYADAYHHPWENELFRHFEGRDADLDKVMHCCEAQHKEMLGAGSSLAESLDCILHDAVIPMDRFTDQLEQFVVQQSEHLDLEDHTLMPHMVRIATTVDWQALEQALSRPDDPLFGETQSTRYSQLYQQLLSGDNDC